MAVTETRTPPGGPDPPSGGASSAGWSAWLASVASRVTSLPVLVVALVVVTLLASGPLHAFDRALNAPWSQWVLEGWRPFFLHVLDRTASRAVGVPILALVALALSRRLRSLRPLVVAAGSVVAVIGLVATMKMVLARPGPATGNPSFFDGGLFTGGKVGIIYPSGHAADAVLLYGVAVYLLAHYGTATRRTVRLLSWGVAAITVVTIATSLYLGWHWATDLLGGVVAGGLALRATTLADRAVPAGVRRTDLPVLLAAPRFSRDLIRGSADRWRLAGTGAQLDSGAPGSAGALPVSAPPHTTDDSSVGSHRSVMELIAPYALPIPRQSPPMRPVSATRAR